jgi:hypothetical protein
MTSKKCLAELTSILLQGLLVLSFLEEIVPKFSDLFGSRNTQVNLVHIDLIFVIWVVLVLVAGDTDALEDIRPVVFTRQKHTSLGDPAGELGNITGFGRGVLDGAD